MAQRDQCSTCMVTLLLSLLNKISNSCISRSSHVSHYVMFKFTFMSSFKFMPIMVTPGDMNIFQVYVMFKFTFTLCHVHVHVMFQVHIDAMSCSSSRSRYVMFTFTLCFKFTFMLCHAQVHVMLKFMIKLCMFMFMLCFKSMLCFKFTFMLCCKSMLRFKFTYMPCHVKLSFSFSSSYVIYAMLYVKLCYAYL